MKTVITNTSRYIYVLLLSGAVTLAGCSKKSDTEQDKNTPEVEVTQTESVESATSEASEAIDVSMAPKEMALVVQNFGMSKFSQFKRFYDIGYTLFSIHSDGTISSGSASGLSDYEIDWISAKADKYDAEKISLQTPAIKKAVGGQTVPSQQISIARKVESKSKLNSSAGFSEVFTIETLVLDSARTVCVLGVSTP
jgi:hypothetical protein